MGWKNIKEHYRIEHMVCVTKDGICIGSPYIHNIIVIALDGTIKKRFDGRSNDDLARYQREFDAAPPWELKALIDTHDTFSTSVPVFTYDGGNVIEKRCEVLGWPNVTHDGQMMYENTFSADKSDIVRVAKNNAAASVEACKRHKADAEEQVAKWESELEQARRDVEKLNSDFP